MTWVNRTQRNQNSRVLQQHGTRCAGFWKHQCPLKCSMQESITIQNQQKENELTWMDFVIVHFQKEGAVHPHEAGRCSPVVPAQRRAMGFFPSRLLLFFHVLSGQGPYRLLWGALVLSDHTLQPPKGWGGRNSSERAIGPWHPAGEVLKAYPKPLPQLPGLTCAALVT